VLEQADCDLLLDINNIYVNSINHRYDAEAYLKALPAGRIAYAHIAGHYREAEDLRIDTHGADVIDPVWQLLAVAYEHFGVFPTLLERIELLVRLIRSKGVGVYFVTQNPLEVPETVLGQLGNRLRFDL
jgi:uncharacterized protein (UPF0276 family)